MTCRTRNRLTVDRVLVCLVKNPYRHIIRRWNWKSALMSAFFRGILIYLANLSAGGASAAGAMLAESCYRATTSGFYGSLNQAFRFAQPAWAASAIPMVLIPVIADSCELAMHGIHGTQRLGATIAASLIFTAISTFLELFAMRRGAFIMGGNSRSLIEDIRSIPRLAAAFVNETRCLFLSFAKAFGKNRPLGQTEVQGSSPIRTGKLVSATSRLLD